MQIPPPLFWQRYGNLHTFPRPTAKPTVAKINSILFPHPPRSSTATSAVTPRASAAFCSAAAFEFSSLAGVIVKFTTPSFRCAVVMVGRKPRTLRCSVWRGQRSLTSREAKTTWKQIPSFVHRAREKLKFQIIVGFRHLYGRFYTSFKSKATRGQQKIPDVSKAILLRSLVYSRKVWMKEAIEFIIGRCQSFCRLFGGNLSAQALLCKQASISSEVRCSNIPGHISSLTNCPSSSKCSLFPKVRQCSEVNCRYHFRWGQKHITLFACTGYHKF